MRRTIFILAILFSLSAAAQDFSQLAVGEKANDFTLKTIDGEKVKLSKLNKNSTIVLLVLRGWPEYQCPICTRQVGSFIAEAEKFKELGAHVLMVYPGPSEVLQEKAKEFSQDFILPDNFTFILDPDYSMINKYGLRWEAKRETAYPSTFVIDKSGEIVFSKISTKHGGRSKVEEVLEVLKNVK
jgi:peroxiredoxin Q/BCP